MPVFANVGRVKKYWGLSIDPKEKAFIDTSDCFNETEAGPEREDK